MTKAEQVEKAFRQATSSPFGEGLNREHSLAKACEERDLLAALAEGFGLTPNDCCSFIVCVGSDSKGFRFVLRPGGEQKTLEKMTQISAVSLGSIHLVRSSEMGLGPDTYRGWVRPFEPEDKQDISILEDALNQMGPGIWDEGK